jgi:hypothetical protein
LRNTRRDSWGIPPNEVELGCQFAAVASTVGIQILLVQHPPILLFDCGSYIIFAYIYYIVVVPCCTFVTLAIVALNFACSHHVPHTSSLKSTTVTANEGIRAWTGKHICTSLDKLSYGVLEVVVGSNTDGL